MTFQPLGSNGAAAEYQRLVTQQAAANKTGDLEQIEHAAHEFAHFMRMAGMGRLDEYFTSRQPGGDQ
jgi:hypothetical protein